MEVSAFDAGLGSTNPWRRLGRRPYPEVLCLAYWTLLKNGFRTLDCVARNIASNEPLQLPSVTDGIRVNIPAIRVGKTIFAQSFSTDIGWNRWPIAWKKLTMLGGYGRGGFELTKLEDIAEAIDRPFEDRHMHKAECIELLQELNWLTLSKHRLRVMAYNAGRRIANECP